jgi:hypothetical protein
MHQRRQVDAAQYDAARAYQQLYDRATIGDYSIADLLRPKVDGGRVRDPITAGRMAAATRLRSVEGTLKNQHGFIGLTLTRAVLIGGKTVEKTARDLGASTERDVRWWGTLLRRCLDVLAKALSFASSAQRIPGARPTVPPRSTSPACTPTPAISPISSCAAGGRTALDGRATT